MLPAVEMNSMVLTLSKILKKFESLNIAFLKDELKKLNSELDKLFGKNTFKMAHNYINDLLRLN